MAVQVDIIENYIDSAGWRRIRAQIDLGDCISLKFPPGMTVEEMKAEAREVIVRYIQGIQTRDGERNRIKQITNAINLYGRGQLTNNQKIALLDALCAEWKG